MKCLIGCIGTVIFAFAASSAAGQDKTGKNAPKPFVRQFYPDAPRIPKLTPQEHAYVNNIIFLFVVNDLKNWVDANDGGQLKKTFNSLGPEALPLLMEWMNYSSARGWTCPCTHINAKLQHFLDEASRKMDIDTLEFMERGLLKEINGKPSPQPLFGLASRSGGLSRGIRAEKIHHVTRLELQDLLTLGNGSTIDHEALKNHHFSTSTKTADWRMVIETLGTKKNKDEVFEFLLGQMKKADTVSQRKAVHDAMKKWSGTDKGPSTYDSPGAATSAAEMWAEWNAQRKKGDLTNPIREDKK